MPCHHADKLSIPRREFCTLSGHSSVSFHARSRSGFPVNTILTSYQLALRDQPTNHKVLQNMAIAFSRTGRQSEAIRCYRRALEIQPKLSGAHYGLAFLLLRRGETNNAAFHLESFLMDPPAPSAEADRWIRHAKETLERIRTTDEPAPGDELESEEYPEVTE